MLLTGDNDFYLRIIDPLGYKVKERSEDFAKKYNAVVNKFTVEFSKKYVTSDGLIDWEALVKMVSSPQTSKKKE